jgi:hypothetical protein
LRSFSCLAAALLLTLSSGPAIAGELSPYRLLRLDHHPVRWLDAALRPKRVLTYKTLEGVSLDPGAVNCRGMTSPAALLKRWRIPQAVWRHELALAFAAWEAAADLKFLEVPTDAHADIVIGAQTDPIGTAFANVAYDANAVTTIKPILGSRICLNPRARWKVGFDGDLHSFDVRYTLTHEIGHAIGLDHPMATGVVMGFRYDEQFRELQAGDVAGAQALFGAPSVRTAGRSIELVKGSEAPLTRQP